jgi:hypothetical protein
MSRPPVSLALPGIPQPQKARPMGVVKWIEGLRAETIDVLRDARAALELDGRISARSVPTVRRIDQLLERLEGK